MNRTFESGSSGSPPSAPASPSTGYPTPGNPATATPATKPGAWWFHMITEELRKVVVDAGLTPDHTTLTQLKQALDILYGRGYLLVRDEKAQGTAGGSSVSGVQTRTLNTVSANTISGASLASNQITLPAGTYRIRAVAGAIVNLHRAYLYNVTDSSILALGRSINGTTGGISDPSETQSEINCRVTLAAQKVIELRHRTSEVYTTYGLGYPINADGVEVYSVVEIFKD